MENELVIFNKYTIIENCIKRINSVYDGKLETLKDFNKQDVIVLNLQRACQEVIDIDMHIISVRNLGAPQSGKGAFTILQDNNIIDKKMTKNMQGMIGFRNIAVHEYQELDLEILKNILDNHLGELREFAREILKKNKGE